MSDPSLTATRYPDLDALSGALAASVGADLRAAILARGSASLIVSGGRSPVRLFEHLRRQTLDWRCVSIGLADERWVSTDDDASNERLIRATLLTEQAAAARFHGLRNDAPSPALGADVAWRGLQEAHRPFDVVLLGMGDDGHTASLFPGSPDLKRALDPAAVPGCIGMQAPSAPRARLSLNLAALLDSLRIVILITGEAKWLTYSTADGPGPAEDMPVRSVLRQRRVPVEVVWSP